MLLKKLSLALLKMGKSLPETCSADLGDLVGFHITLPTLKMLLSVASKFAINCSQLPWNYFESIKF